ncbi:ABC transporter substrate-binding protein [Actinomycetospora endophytica]|uniref:ABC transporter substrate-binding protein n=1 Tax=Actinomycetospora endophytica TaxID=2291215 RepID=A0ABS8PCZ1_9PSEU|nr:ABC transporter substrate-binding protein [Actinomycetospora endophytica]MCD2195772.1 ABC transporter substrate-binding protein [Actinomycetospora endophytica]
MALTGIVLTVGSACAVPSASSGPASGGGPEATVTDVLGRQVTLPLPSSRILLGGSRMLYTTAMLNPANPVANVVGWPNDLQQNDPDTYNRYAAKFPQVAQVPVLGQLPNGSFSAEKAIDLKPDVFVISAANFPAARDAGTIDQLDRAGIPTVVVDYFTDPLRNTVPSVQLLGRIFGREQAAANYVDWYQATMNRVRARLDAAHPAPTPTFFWRAPGYYDCCSTFARSNLAQLVTWAGGANLGDELLKSPQGTLSPETVLSRNEPVVIATGADWAAGAAQPDNVVKLGYDETPQAAQQQLQQVIARQPGFGDLAAVRNKQVHVAWHHFYDSPYNVLAAEWFAKWLHPDLFPDVDPATTMTDLHRRFLPVAPGGTFSTDLP